MIIRCEASPSAPNAPKCVSPDALPRVEKMRSIPADKQTPAQKKSVQLLAATPRSPADEGVNPFY
jgi:hypothetical protein